MSLLQEYAQNVKRIIGEETPDGLGGSIIEWKEKESFKASISYDTSIEAQKAAKEGVTGLYTISFPTNIEMRYHDVIQADNGKSYRVTSNDLKETPARASFQIKQVTAEEWVIPND